MTTAQEGFPHYCKFCNTYSYASFKRDVTMADMMVVLSPAEC